MLQDTEFVILVTERFHWLVKPLLYFYDKYMPVPLTFFSDRLIEGANAIEVFPLDMHIYQEPCGKLIKDALRKLDKPVVMFGYMDLLPVRTVDLHLLGILEKYMLEDKNAARGNLWAPADNAVKSSKEIVQEGEGYSIRRLSSADPNIGQIGASSLLPALWRTDFLLEFIEDGWTFDAVELPGQYKFMAQRKWHSVGMLPGLFDSCHLCYTADKSIVKLSTLADEEDRAFVAQFVPEGRRIT